jgi:hypothetical protein
MKKYFLMILPSVIIISLFYVLKPNNSDNKKLNELKKDNIILQNKNDSIFLVIQSLEKLKIQADLNIEKLRNQENS